MTQDDTDILDAMESAALAIETKHHLNFVDDGSTIINVPLGGGMDSLAKAIEQAQGLKRVLMKNTPIGVHVLGVTLWLS